MKEIEFGKLPPLGLPTAGLRIEKDNEGNLFVYDKLRKRMVALTPEEYVRQTFVEWLINERGYPASHMANEVKLDINGMAKRSDTVIFGYDGVPLIVIEYKAPNVQITQETFDQIVRYNMSLKARYLIVSNGINSYCCVIDYQRNTFNFIRTIPTYREAIGLPSVN